MTRSRILWSLFVAVAWLAPASGQTGFKNSLAIDWSHAWGSPYFTDNVASGESLYGVIDHLNVVWWLEYTSPAISLAPGRYVATARIRNTNPVGAAPINVWTVVDGVSRSVTLPTSQQPSSQWIETPPLFFDVGPSTPAITFGLGNYDNVPKQDYDFDSFSIKALPTVSSLALDWGHVHGAPYFNDDVPSSESIRGYVDVLNFVTWLEYYSPAMSLPPGTYSAKARLKKTVGSGLADDLNLQATVGATSTSSTLYASNQPVNQWVETPPVTFTIATLSDTVSFWFGNIATTPKGGYMFDRLEIVPVSPGLVALLPDRQASIGVTTTLDIFCPASPGLSAICAFSFGTGPTTIGDGRAAPITLDSLTDFSLAPGNGVFSNMFTVLNGSGVASLKPAVAVPNDPGIAGITIYAVAVTLDSSNPTGIGGISTACPFTFVP